MKGRKGSGGDAKSGRDNIHDEVRGGFARERPSGSFVKVSDSEFSVSLNMRLGQRELSGS